MNHKRFRDDMIFMALHLKELNEQVKLLPVEVSLEMSETVMLLNKKLDDIVKDVYAEQIKKGDWLSKYD